MSLRRESPFRGRRLRLDEALLERALMSRVGYQFLLHLAPRIDKALIPRTKGRLSSAGIDQVGLVTTTGGKSGQPRTQPLALIDDSDGLLAIGSNYGRAKHPGWSANLLAHPECTVEFRGPPAQYRAELLTDDARASAWATATDCYAGYERYRATCAPRGSLGAQAAGAHLPRVQIHLSHRLRLPSLLRRLREGGQDRVFFGELTPLFIGQLVERPQAPGGWPDIQRHFLMPTFVL